MGPRIWVYRSKLHWLRLECVARKKEDLGRVGFQWVEKGRRRVLQADDRETCASFKVLEVSAALTGAEAQGWLSWRVPDARASDVESLQGFDLSSEMTTKRLLVIARVEGRWIGWEEAEQKTSAGDWIRRMLDGRGPESPQGNSVKGDISHDGQPPEKEQAHPCVMSSVLGVLNLRCA